jgi:hypothetical protein
MTAAACAARRFVRVLRDDQQQTKGTENGTGHVRLHAAIAPELPVDLKADDAAELHYWHKHPNLHGWMERLFRTKGNARNFQLRERAAHQRRPQGVGKTPSGLGTFR